MKKREQIECMDRFVNDFEKRNVVNFEIISQLSEKKGNANEDLIMRGADCLTLESLLAVGSTPLSAWWNMRNGT